MSMFRRGTLIISTAALIVPLSGGSAVAAPGDPPLPIYLDRSYSAEERAADLVSRMTLEEKAAQMNSSQSAPIPRLGVAAYGWWNEAAHGVAREGTLNNANPPTLINTTSYPVDLSMGSTWNPALMHREAAMISDEAREVVRNNNLDLNFYSPTVNLARDPRWGRNDETFSEDPLLTTAIAAQFVNGMEGKDVDGRPLPAARGYRKVSTTLKHYAANNSEFNRRTGSSDMDDRTLREYYTAQFKDLVRQSDPASIMSAYNRVNGVPAAADVYLMDTLARQTFGFNGFFTSDCDAIFEIQAGHHWQPPGYPHPLDHIERHAFANSAGEDLDCQRGFHDEFNYGNTLPTAVTAGIETQTGIYNENDMDVSLVRLFTARIKLGEFDDQSRVPWVTRARAEVPPGTWTNTDANNAVTETPERLAMARRAGDQSIVLLKNDATTKRDGTAGKLLPLRVPASGPFKVAVIGAYANPASMYLGGYSSNQGPAGVAKSVNGYQGIRAAVRAVNPDAAVDFLPGVTGPGLGTVDQASVDAAAGYDAVIVYAGTDAGTAREDIDRATLALPGAQADMINQVAARNPATVVYMETVGQVDVASFEPNVAALLWSSYNGQRKGEALADVLLGAHNPSGHLPFSWYADLSQLPALGDYGIRPSGSSLGRTYMYFKGRVSYPFGYGLGYSTFRYSRLDVDRRHVDANGTLHVSANVTNTGPVAGDTVAQLYITTPDAPAALERPIKRLRAFEKISLAPHQTKRVRFTVRVPDLAFFDQDQRRYVVDRGRYGIQLGTSSADADIQRQTTVTVSGALRPTPAVVTAKPVAAGDAARGIASRVFIPRDTVVDPQLTVGMSDDTLFGHITRGASRPLPPGMTVRYRSNRPAVVSVDRAGVVRTAAPGVATVTATVTYRGAMASSRFVVYVR
ncbi:MAG TPA: glycoside hydrolase family 3 C-terminal domain-containing protein [Streptosporangiaceae bacterium]|nr:glycoside hydrolase family 3 C-terminal domain-containing protein [Streptosporangiaceae bacterium]